MDDFSVAEIAQGFRVKLWRGERMCLLGMDVDQPEADLVGFSIEVMEPRGQNFVPLNNRLNFSYDQPAGAAVTGGRLFSSRDAPFQKFRWIHFPWDVKNGTYRYRVTKMHMSLDGKLVQGRQIELGLSLDPVTYDGFLDIGFTRNFASSQAFAEKFGDRPELIPDKASAGLEYQKANGGVYQWLGFEALQLLEDLLEAAIADPSCTVDLLAYDLNEPDIVARLERLGGRLRAVIDNSGEHGKHDSAESKSAARLAVTAGGMQVKRTHFQGLQHHKVIVVKRDGKPEQVLFGSTNFSFRGLYIQANNLIVVRAPEAAALFAQVFEEAFRDPGHFATNPLAQQWHLIKVDGKPALHFCFSPHQSSALSLNPVGAAIDQASSSVLYSVAFLNMIDSGPTREALDRLIGRPVFSYGVVNNDAGLAVRKPDGSVGLVDFAYLAGKAPQPFRREWSGGQGINIHHKFIVTDFSLASAKVFTGSSNLAPSGESGNGDNLMMIEDSKVATAYAIEALRMFDHLHFRTLMKETFAPAAPQLAPKSLTLKKPTAISGEPAWFESSFVPGSQKEKDRRLFSS